MLAVVDRRFDDRQARRRTLLSGVPERRADEVANGVVEVG